MRRCRDSLSKIGIGRITVDVVNTTLSMLGIDADGLDEIDRKIYCRSSRHYGGGPVGINTLPLS